MSEWDKIPKVSGLEFKHSVNLAKIGGYQPTIDYVASFEAADDKMFVGTNYNGVRTSAWLTWAETLQLKKWIELELFRRKLPMS